MPNIELHVISLTYSEEVRPGRPIIECSIPDESEWSFKETEFYEFYVNRELSKLPADIDYNLSYWSMKSQNLEHFVFAEGYFHKIYLVLGREIMYWQAESGSGDVKVLHGAMLFDSHLCRDICVTDVENILDTIRV